SLVYLKRLPLDEIKIDKIFVSGIGINQDDEAIVETTLTLAKRLNLQSVAEGVETKEQRDYLIHNNCHYIQGYLYSRPLPANEIMTILMTDNAV
ncbi:MAG: EAL domain-containing protein, partial [Alteromonadaceae bacterium]